MSRIQQALQKLQTNTSVPIKLVEQYIETGDAKILGAMKPIRSGGGWSWEGHVLGGALGPVRGWTDEDRRLLHVLNAVGLLESVDGCLDGSLREEKPGEDFHGIVRAELESRKASSKAIVELTSSLRHFVRDGKPTSAGRFALAMSDADLKLAIRQKRYGNVNLELLGLLVEFAVDRVPALLPLLLTDEGHSGNASAVVGVLLGKAGSRFEKEVAAFFRSMSDPWHRFWVAVELVKFDRAKYADEGLKAAKVSLAGPGGSNNHNMVGEWMLQQFGAAVLPDIVAYLRDDKHASAYWKEYLLDVAVSKLGREALPAVHASLEAAGHTKLQLNAIEHLIALNADRAEDAVISSELAKCLRLGADERPSYRTTDTFESLIRAVGLAGRWGGAKFAERLWELADHKSKPVRGAAARVLGQTGGNAVPRAVSLLNDGNAAGRSSAVIILTTAGTPEAVKALEKRLDAESDDDVRDAILVALESAWAAAGRKVTKKDIDARIARAADKLKAAPPAWIKEAKLPPLRFQKGGPLNKEAVRYLLYRQARAKEMRADVEAKALLALIDRSSSGDFALEILKGYLASKVDAADRWALTLAALLGDDRIVPLLNQQIRQWADASRGKLAEYAVQALALLGTDAALLTVDAMAIRYRSKNKNVGRAAVEAFAAAAETLGITPEELGDRVVPWLGFEPGKPRVIDCGGRKFEVRIGPELKLKYIDVEKNKPAASLPKTAPKEAAAELKDLGATLREVVKAQLLRLENLMVRQHRWPAARWRELFTTHPVLLPLATRLVWAAYDGDGRGKPAATFRVLEDRTLTDAADDPVAAPKSGTIGIVHPLELSDAERTAWQTHLADYEVEPPFPQLERPVVRLDPERADKRSLTEFSGADINGMTFKGRAERLGWVRGSVCDGGGITSYFKSFPAAGVDVFLGLEGMYIGIDMGSNIKLEDTRFVRAGSVRTGSYTYDEPSGDKDERVLRFGDVPPIVWSEVLGDLQKISGKAQTGEADEE